MHVLTPLPFGSGSVMLYASHVKLPPRYSARIGTPLALACSSSSSTSTPVCNNNTAHDASTCLMFHLVHAMNDIITHICLACSFLLNVHITSTSMLLEVNTVILLGRFQTRCQRDCSMARMRHTSPFAHHKPVPVLVPRPGGFAGVLIPPGQRFARYEASHS